MLVDFGKSLISFRAKLGYPVFDFIFLNYSLVIKSEYCSKIRFPSAILTTHELLNLEVFDIVRLRSQKIGNARAVIPRRNCLEIEIGIQSLPCRG